MFDHHTHLLSQILQGQAVITAQLAQILNQTESRLNAGDQKSFNALCAGLSNLSKQSKTIADAALVPANPKGPKK